MNRLVWMVLVVSGVTANAMAYRQDVGAGNSTLISATTSPDGGKGRDEDDEEDFRKPFVVRE